MLIRKFIVFFYCWLGVWNEIIKIYFIKKNWLMFKVIFYLKIFVLSFFWIGIIFIDYEYVVWIYIIVIYFFKGIKLCIYVGGKI